MRVAVCAVLGPWATPDLDQGESPVKNPRLSMRQLEVVTGPARSDVVAIVSQITEHGLLITASET